MVVTMQYSSDLATRGLLAFRLSAHLYELVWAEVLTNGIAEYIVRKLKKVTVDFSVSPPQWGSVSEIDVATPSGLSNPIVAYCYVLGYDFENDEILIALGEWNGSSAYLESTTVKLLAVKRDFSNVTVLHDDLFSLVQTAAADATKIRSYAHFMGYGGKIVGALGVYANGDERSVVILYDGSVWSAVRANDAYDYIQEKVEPIWDTEDNFIGWLTEGHGTNTQFIKYPELTVTAKPPAGTLFTTEPIYDMLNHKVIFIEWGSATGDTQHVLVADPDPTDGYANLTDVTPTGTITDNEANSIDLNTVNKAHGLIFSDGVNTWLVFVGTRGGIPTDKTRVLKVDLGSYSDPAKYDVIADPTNDDRYELRGLCRAIDPTSKLFVPSPIFVVLPKP